MKGKKTEIGKNKKATPSIKVMERKIDWYNELEVLIKDEPRNAVFVHKKFADESIFGEGCVFVNCKFGSDCRFGLGCEFAGDCQLGPGQKYGTDDDGPPYWDPTY